LTVVDGALDALDRIAQVVVHLGDRVVVEHPTFPPLLDLLERLGAVVIGVPLDDEGVCLDDLERALASSPTALFLQPRAQNPTGITMTARRARDIARLVGRSVDGSRLVIVEDDHSGDIAQGDPVSVGQHLPSQTVHIRSYSKSHGPDLRLAAVAGAGEVIIAAANRRMLGPGWSSRILQAVLFELLDDSSTLRALEHARREYADRRRRVVEILSAAGVTTTGNDGINLWVHVDDERAALVSLAAQGIGAAPGEPFLVDDHPPALRLTVGLLGPTTDLEATAATIASAAAMSGDSRRGQR
jgi:DNA-binding transcriptional MocR family regulator